MVEGSVVWGTGAGLVGGTGKKLGVFRWYGDEMLDCSVMKN
jgi:hypothetical protein